MADLKEMSLFRLPLLLVLPALVALASLQARAAESYANCTGTIEALPATISAPGTWCLKQNLATSMSSGNAIQIQSDHVTVDCNDFTLSGFGAGNGSTVRGINASNRTDVTVRNCRIGGFHFGIALAGTGGGHRVEDNHLLMNLYRGIHVAGTANLVRGNRIEDTGGAPGSNASEGIYAAADIVDNTVNGVFADHADSSPSGIALAGDGTSARGNQVHGIAPSGEGRANGINVLGRHNLVTGNQVNSELVYNHGLYTRGFGINGNGATSTFSGHNFVSGFSASSIECQDIGGNVFIYFAPP